MRLPEFARINRATLIAVLVFLAAESILAWALWMTFHNETSHLLKLYRSELVRSYRDVIDSHARLVTAVNHQSVDLPAVRELLAEVAKAPEAERSAIRGRLYRQLAPVYDLLRTHDVRVLQLVEPNGRSFLRFNRPDLYNDPIAAKRPVLAEVIESQQAAQGFENGRVYPGYRYAYPLFHEGRLIGIADYSLSFDAFRRTARRIGEIASASTEADRLVANRLILRRDLMRDVAHPSSLSLFQPVLLHPDFVVEDEANPLRDSNFIEPLAPWMQALDLKLATDQQIQQALVEGQPSARYTCLNVARCWAVLLLPVRDNQGRVAASFVSYTEVPEYALHREQLLAIFVGISLIFALLGWTLRSWIASRQRLQTIGDYMAEGLYVMDHRGLIIYANQAASQLLGYSHKQFIRQSAHKLFHYHEDAPAVSPTKCPLYQSPLSGEVYRSETEVFRCRNGDLLPVSVVASPLRVEGELSGSVVLFRDLRAEIAAKEKLQTTDVAFRNLAEAVCVTDHQPRIKAVNAAFVRITGYREEEVLGKNPNIFASGRHDQAFYQGLWADLLTKGYWEGEIWDRRKNGEIYPEWLKINAVHDQASAIVGFVSVFDDISEARAKEERLNELAYYDQVTGLYNRNAFMETLEDALAQSQVSGRQFALLLCDIDRFKRINDSLGHLAGDEVLKRLAERISTLLGIGDYAARCGGDEFALMIRPVEQRAALTRRAHALLALVRQPIDIQGKRIDLSASIGIAIYPSDGKDVATLLKHANAAVQLAKAQGRNGYRYFTAALDDDANSCFELESALRGALRDEQFRLHYQPKISLVDGQVVGLEALVRWQHPTQGLLSPAVFLTVARDAGLMQPITEWVLQEACRQRKQWQAEGLNVGRVSINLDVGFFQPLVLEATLRQTVREAGITPSDIEFEILETAMRDVPETAELWQRLVAAGFELSIDDFGTGESSLSRLKHLPFSVLKIDRKFVIDIEEQENDRALVRTIIGMAKNLGKIALAEGVETEQQLRYLMSCGCELVQGYFFCKPCAANAIEDFVNGKTSIELIKRLRHRSSFGDGVVTYFDSAQGRT